MQIYNITSIITAPTEVPRSVSVTINSSRSIMLSWERPSIEEENGLLIRYHVIVIETQIHYTDDGVEITGMQKYLNTTYNVSEGRAQLIESLHPDYNYTVRIAAATEPGIGPFSDAITVRTDMDGELFIHNLYHDTFFCFNSLNKGNYPTIIFCSYYWKAIVKRLSCL